jgi:tetratricopeptide (TPR) repeat protein
MVVVALLAGVAGCSPRGSAQELFEKGKRKVAQNRPNDGYRYFKQAAQKAPDSAHYHWAAAQTAPNQNAAYLHTRDAWEHGAHSQTALVELVRLSFHTEKQKKLAFALSLYEQLADSSKSEDFLSDIFEIHGQLDSALSIRQRLFAHNQSAENATRLARVLLKMNQPDSARAVLENCKNQKQLNGVGYTLLASLYAVGYEYSKIINLFDEAKMLGHYSEAVQLEHASFLIAQEKFDDAEKVLAGLLKPVNAAATKATNIHARFLQSYLAMQRAQSTKLDELIGIAEAQKGSLGVQESAFYRALKKKLTDSTVELESLAKAQQAFSSDPIVNMFYARELVRAKEYRKALDFYKLLPAVMRRSPRFVYEYAVVLSQIGQLDSALIAISTLHHNKVFTRNSLQLFRDLTFKKNLVEKSAAAQQLLEQQFSGDVGVRWSGAVLALRTGEHEKALRVFSDLARTYPTEERFETARIATYLFQGENQKVIDECAKSSFRTPSLLKLKARAYRGLGDDVQASQVYSQAAKSGADAATLMEYADFLLSLKKPGDAAAVYEQLRGIVSTGAKQDSVQMAMVLNNLAWSYIQNGTAELAKVVEIAQLAHRYMSSSVHILDTYADVLNRAQRYKETITLLDNNALAEREPRLLFHLAAALEKAGQRNKSLRVYQDVLGRMQDTTVTLPMHISSEKIKTHMSSMTVDK